MNKSLVSIALLLAMLVPTVVVASGKDDCDTVKETDCDLVRHGVKRQLIPTDDLDCIYFVQRAPSDVLLTIIPKDAKRSPRPYTKKNAARSARFCVGRSFVKNAQAMCMCNESDGSAIFTASDVAKIAEKPKDARMPGEACLYGEKECAAMGYKPQGSLPSDVLQRLKSQCEDAFKKWRASHR